MTDPVAKPETAKVAAPVTAAPAKAPASTPAAKPVAASAPKRPAAPVKAAKPVAKKPAPVVTAPAAAAPVQKTIEKTVETLAAPAKAVSAAKDKTMTDIKQAAETMTAKAKTMFADANDRTKGAMEKGQKLVDEMTAFNKGNIEAIVESSKIAARGFETLGQDAVAYAKQSFEHATATAKTMATVKSPTDFLKLQSDYVRTSFDAMVAHGSRSTETMLKLAGEVAQPISNRMALAAEKVKQAA